MLKTTVIVIAGLAAGFALATWWPGTGGEFSSAERLSSSLVATAELPERFIELELALLEEIDRRAQLERRVQELGDELAELRSDPAAQSIAASDALAGGRRPGESEAQPAAREPPAWRAGGRFRNADPQAQAEQLVNAGFTPARADWISRRAAELQMQALQAVYDARRDGKPLDPATVPDQQSLLRKELGDTEFEQYLGALGRSTSIGVRDVLASSPAESAGLQVGDEIVSYGGTRVFDMRDLNRLTFEGQLGEPVIVEVLRDGRQVQMVLPRGPVGITGRFGGRP
jgi:hypothetical protein